MTQSRDFSTAFDAIVRYPNGHVYVRYVLECGTGETEKWRVYSTSGLSRRDTFDYDTRRCAYRDFMERVRSSVYIAGAP